MKRNIIILLFLGLIIGILSFFYYNKKSKTQEGNYVMVIHGGAGTILKSEMTPEKELRYQTTLKLALQKGYEVLQEGKPSIDAVEAALRIMEDSPMFNAGKGAVFTHEGKNEMDAAIMDGKTLKAGAVASVTIIRNPISAARAVLEKSPHVMMVGKGAEKFASEQQLEIVDPSYFFTESRWNSLQKVLKEDSQDQSANHHSHQKNQDEFLSLSMNEDRKFGTVGAVALDKNGNLAAGTSTGGMTDKRYGRVGDAPIIGAGTYANDEVAISCTGWGEFFIRNVVAHDVAALMRYAHKSVKEATEELIFDKVPKLGGDGGLIALDKNGNISMPFNTAGMYRGTVTKDGKIEVFIYK